MSQLFASGGQSTGTSALASVLSMNSQGWFTLGSTGFTSLQSRGLSRVFSSTTIQKHQFCKHQFFDASSIKKYQSLPDGPTLTSVQDYWKNQSFPLIHTFDGKVMSLFFNMLSRFDTVFLPRSKHLLISLLQSPSAVILEPKKIKFATVSIFSPFYLPWSNGTRCHDCSFLNVEF